MYSSPARKIKKKNSVFKTPMTYNPRVVDNKPLPSPSRIELWKRQLGLDEDPNVSGPCTSDSEGEDSFNGAFSGTVPRSSCSQLEFKILQKEVAERNGQRDELLFNIKTLNEKNKMYKSRLEKEESNKKMQVKMLRRSYDTYLEEKETLIKNLEAIIEEHETESGGVQKTGDSPKKPATSQLVQQVTILQDEKNKQTEKIQELTGLRDTCQQDHIHQIVQLQDTVVKLQRESSELRAQTTLLQESQVMVASHGPCSTDTEKQLEVLEQQNKSLHEELLTVQASPSKSTPVSSHGRQHGSHRLEIKLLEGENGRLKERIKTLENDVILKTQQSSDLESQLRKENHNLMAEIRQINRELRDLHAKIYALQAKSPEVISRVERINVEIDSQETKLALSKAQQSIAQLEQQLQTLEEKDRQRKQDADAEIHELDQTIQVLKALGAEKERELDTEVSRLQEQIGGIQDLNQQSQDSSQRRVTELQEQVHTIRRMHAETSLQLDLAMQKTLHLQDQLQICKKDKEDIKTQIEVEKKLLEDVLREEIAVVKTESESNMKILKTNYDAVKAKLVALRPCISGLMCSYVKLRKESKLSAKIYREGIQSVEKQTCAAIVGLGLYNQELVRRYHKEMKLRKKYHNELVELKGNIRVFCRVRPQITEDGVGQQAEGVVFYDKDDDGLVFVNSKGRNQTFEVDRVFRNTSTQVEVFDEVQSLVTSCVDGFNVCIFAYGQTGSGKTYTMEGPASDPGINQRALNLLFEEIVDRGLDWQYTVTVSAIEIYNENIRDLLSEDPLCKLEVKMSLEGGLHVPGLSLYTVETVADVNEVFTLGKKNRVTASTNMNEHSSRSHALLCITVTGVNRTTDSKTTGKLHLVDLAGSERVSKSGADGTRLMEAQNINKSLSCLGNVIHALRTKQSFIPYRNSKLTYMLQDSLGGDSKTLMIVHVAPVEWNVGETICSLNFAQRVRTVELGAASKRIEVATIGDRTGLENGARSPQVKSPKLPTKNATPKSVTPRGGRWK